MLSLAQSPEPLVADIGLHVIGDFQDVDPKILADEKFLMKALDEALRDARFNILGEKSIKVPGEESGVTGIIILSESHAAFHSYPEYGYIAVDVFSCGETSPEAVVDGFARRLRAGTVNKRIMERGKDVRRF